MAMGVRDVALWCAVVAAVVTTAATYTVDCNREYTGCDNELSELLRNSTGKKDGEDEKAIASQQLSHLTLPPFAFISATIPTKVFPESTRTTTRTTSPTRSMSAPDQTTDSKGDVDTTTTMSEINDPMLEPKLRLPRFITSGPENKNRSDKFKSNLQIPFNPLLSINKSDEINMCKENETMYKVGEHIDRGCDETCECTVTGVFHCSPRCQDPYIRRGRRLTDPLCFESPVDECCSVIACASGSGGPKSTTIEMSTKNSTTTNSNTPVTPSYYKSLSSMLTPKPRLPRLITSEPKNKDISIDTSDEIKMCKENATMYKVGEHIDRGCDETCECTATGVFDCSPRCQHPYRRRVGRLSDPYCHESPVDECCALIACSSGTATPVTSSIYISLSPMLKPKPRLPRLITSGPKNKDIFINKSDEIKMCKENETMYKVGEHIDRGCDETCECTATGVFDCSPRCQHPYRRRVGRLSDPYCHESPIDECCALIACSSGTGEPKSTTIEMCRYGSETYPVGVKWHIGCEQTCVCEGNSIITCKPRCNRLPLSDKCINVQDPNDECCEVQVCDISSGAHEKPSNITISSPSSSS